MSGNYFCIFAHVDSCAQNKSTTHFSHSVVQKIQIMKQDQKNKYWKICYISALILSILTFTPLVIPYHTYKPMIGHVPYTMWMGFLIYILLVILTFIGIRVYPDNDHQEK
jgi:hypothetical protein